MNIPFNDFSIGQGIGSRSSIYLLKKSILKKPGVPLNADFSFSLCLFIVLSKVNPCSQSLFKEIACISGFCSNFLKTSLIFI